MSNLQELSEKAAAGDWVYRPYEQDDWGVIRGGELEQDDTDLARPIVAEAKPLSGDRDFDKHRAAGTDPMEANGEFIVALVNAYRAGELIERKRKSVVTNG